MRVPMMRSDHAYSDVRLANPAGGLAFVSKSKLFFPSKNKSNNICNPPPPPPQKKKGVISRQNW